MGLRDRIAGLYGGQGRAATRFRYGLIGLDVATVVFFIVTVPLAPSPELRAIEAAIGALILTDLSLRIWVSPHRWRTVLTVQTLADVVVMLSLVAEPLLGVNLSFLKALRALRLVHSLRVLRDLRRDTAFFRDHEHAIVAGVDLFTFIFVATSLVYVLQFGAQPSAAVYVEALYFTVATLTTTGYGDITMDTTGGKLLAVVMMVVGVALFFRLARALFIPARTRQRCDDCGLEGHERDAVHCRRCGALLQAPAPSSGPRAE